MRVVAGSARGRRLTAPPGSATRPTSDRVREAIFNALHSLDAIEGARVLDLYAGSGALGIEALSRGAASVTFVERDRVALAAIRANLAAARLDADRATVVAGDAVRYCATTTARFDLACIDPPYAFEAWTDLLAVVPADLAVIESDREIVAPGWAAIRSRRYGATVVTFARRSTDPSEQDQQ